MATKTDTHQSLQNIMLFGGNSSQGRNNTRSLFGDFDSVDYAGEYDSPTDRRDSLSFSANFSSMSFTVVVDAR